MKNPDIAPVSEASLRRAGVPHSITPDSPAAGAGIGAATGAATGAVVGAFAGPPGMLVGAVIGAAAGAAAGAALANDRDQADLNEGLDAEIGVSGGDMGAAKPGAPKATRGVYSGASAGVGGIGGSDTTPDEGPIPTAD